MKVIYKLLGLIFVAGISLLNCIFMLYVFLCLNINGAGYFYIYELNSIIRLIELIISLFGVFGLIYWIKISFKGVIENG